MAQKSVEIKVLNSKELEQFWDEFAMGYTLNGAPGVSILSVSMINMLRIQQSKKILEIAVGPGFYVPHLIQRKNKDAELYLTDLSSGLLTFTKARIEAFLKDPISGPYQDLDYKTVDPKGVQFPHKFEEIKTHLELANSEKLIYKDGEFDTYICSLCLQETTDPQQMIKEAYRVLSPGGVAALSVWGSKFEHHVVDHIPQILESLGIKSPVNKRSSFHLNDQQNLVSMFEKEGFTNVLTWRQFIPFDLVSSLNDIEGYLNSPMVNGTIAEMQVEDRADEIKQALVKKMTQFLNDKQPLGMEAILVKVQKPQ